MKDRLLVLMSLFALLMPFGEGRAETNPVFSKEYLSEVMRHLYWWHLDETALLTLDDAPEIEFRVKPVTPKLDEGDQSQYYEMLVPQLSFRVMLKKADYRVAEMNLRIENREFRILRAEKIEGLPPPLDSYQLIRVSRKTILDYLFATRNKTEFPDQAMMERMRKALREQLGAPDSGTTNGVHTIYVAPISPVANDLWLYWESGGKIIRFSSDTDLTTRAFWDYEKLGVRVYDLRENVVVSLAEAAGSNVFVTRDWAARVLFNCVVHGKRMAVMPEADLNKPVKAAEAPVFRP